MSVVWWMLVASSLAAGVGDVAPKITAGAVSSEGRPVLVNFWATWCAPCRAELPLLQALHNRLADDPADVIGVNIDTQRKAAEGYLRRFKLTMPVAFDPKGELAKQYAPAAMPTSYLLDANGTILKVYEGELDEASVSAIEADLRAASKK